MLVVAYNNQMDARFLLDNLHKQQGPKHFAELDSHLCNLKPLSYVHTPALLEQLPIDLPGLYTLTGGCLTGKTTLLKRWMLKLLADGVQAETITFFAGELVANHVDLIQLLQTQLKQPFSIQYIIIDEITHVRDWQKAIKFAVDAGLLDRLIILVTSSDKSIAKEILLLSQRENVAKTNDFQLNPLTFHESVSLKHPEVQVADINLYNEFNDYLLHGGYLVAINDMASHGKILDETLTNYTNSLRKALLRHGKQEHFLREILTAIIEHYCRPVTWNMLSQELSINHPKTIGDYTTLLESLDAVYIQSALLEEKLKGAPKKARKLMFTDPFIFHAISAWLQQPNKNIVENDTRSALASSELSSNLVRACAISHYRRYYPTYHIKAEGEIDLAYIYQQRFWPVVITWMNQLRTKDLKQLLKYANGKMLTNASRSGIIEHIRTEPLPQALWKLQERYRTGKHHDK